MNHTPRRTVLCLSFVIFWCHGHTCFYPESTRLLILIGFGRCCKAVIWVNSLWYDYEPAEFEPGARASSSPARKASWRQTAGLSPLATATTRMRTTMRLAPLLLLATLATPTLNAQT